MTRKLYYEDAYIKEFSARVLSCEQNGDSFAVTLDRTAFFPEGGGQSADAGRIAGISVIDVQERGEEVIHILPEPLEVGSEVAGALDWPERMRRMQNHTGEHIVSGTIHRLFGYDNVGFHMDARGCTFDFNGEISDADIERVETLANEAVWMNAPVRAYFPTPQELEAMEYRSKKELDGAVRIVEIEGVDRCACCAPHVAMTGEVGLIKFTDTMRHRGGVRIFAVCGADALRDYRARFQNVGDISHALSAKPLETAAAVTRVLGELESKKREIVKLQREIISYKAAALQYTDGNLCVFEGPLDEISLRELVNAGMEKSRVCAAFSGEDGDFKYIIGSKKADLRAAAKAVNAAISGRGGGRPEMIMGSCRASRKTIEEFFGATFF